LIRLGIRHDWHFAQGSLITGLRNDMAAYFLDSRYSHLFWIDADIDFAPEAALKLLSLGENIAVGAYRIKRPNGSYAAAKDGHQLTDLSQLNGPTEIDWAGCGFMLIKREVMETLAAASDKYYLEDGRVVPGLYASLCSNGFFQGEDLYWCQRAWIAGYRIVLDPTIRLGHIGQFVYGDPPVWITEHVEGRAAEMPRSPT
jgi:hypothetical protein